MQEANITKALQDISKALENNNAVQNVVVKITLKNTDKAKESK